MAGIDWNDIKRRIEAKTVKKGEHLIAKSGDQWKLFNGSKAYAWHYWLKNGRNRPAEYKDRKFKKVDCDVPDCIAHWIPLPKEVSSVTELTDQDRRFVQAYMDKNSTEEKTESKDPCILWTMALDKEGYGRATVVGMNKKCHVLAWELEHRQDVPEGQDVFHVGECKHAHCVKVTHLQAGTRTESAAARAVRGTIPHKVTAEQLQKALSLVGKAGTYAERAKEVGVSPGIFKDIAQGATHKRAGTAAQNAAREQERAAKKPRAARTFEQMVRRALHHIEEWTHEEIDEKGEVHLIWDGEPDKFDNGKFSFAGTKRRAHRSCYMVYHRLRTLDPKVKIRHKCMVKLCVKKEHLEMGTQQQNMDDKVRDHTQPQGETHYAATISEELARQIKFTPSNGQTRQERADGFGVSYAIVADIDLGRTWKHLVKA